jgi:hypothetical protein
VSGDARERSAGDIVALTQPEIPLIITLGLV